MKLNLTNKQLILIIISLLCIIISFIVDIFFKNIISMYIEYSCIGIALISLLIVIINKSIMKNDDDK